MDSEEKRKKYISAADQYKLLENKEERLLLILSVLRLAVFVSGLILIWVGFNTSVYAGTALIIIIAALFLYLLKLYSVHSEKKTFQHNLSRVNLNEADALNGDLTAFEDGNSFIDPHHYFSADLDLFGANSLFQYLNRTVTGYGRDLLADWLSDPFPLSPDLAARQDAVRELAMKERWRHCFMASGMGMPLGNSDISALRVWMNEKSDIRSSALINILCYFLPVLSVTALIFFAAGLIHYSVFIFLFLLNLLIVSARLKKTNRIHVALSGKHSYLSLFYNLIKIFESETFNSSILNGISKDLCGSNRSAADAVRRLGRLIQAFDSRLNIFAGFIINGLLLWDFQCIYRLDKWKSEYRDLFPAWLELIGEADAFVSIGNYACNNPGFAYPVLSGNEILLSATSLGHPLINEDRRVCNDFICGKRGEIYIISGANMSGKSTFLRTVAVNYLLGMAGAPVCAKDMIFKPVKLFTSMRTIDSLSGNESYFYAELKRLRILKYEIEKQEPLFFILDEILKGTNSADKSLGSRLFIKRIVELGGTGLIATHDISLGELEQESPGAVKNMCFEIEIEGESILFDYKLRHGITRKMNAAILMRQMGIID